MATKLGLYNDALLVLGQERLLSLAESSTARFALDDAYDKAVAYCLEQGFWNHAMRTIQADSSPSIAPQFGYSHAFEKPEDFVRLHSMSANERMDFPLLQFVDEAGIWYADADPIFAKYVSNHVGYGLDLSRWPETFSNYVAHRLALRTCKRITGSGASDDLIAAEEKARRDARSKDAMNEPPGQPPSGTWVRSRGGGGDGSRWDRRNWTQ